MEQLTPECHGGRSSVNGIRSDIRQYLVLLQDALAIKFVPIQQNSYKNNSKDPGHCTVDDKSHAVETPLPNFNHTTPDSSLKGIFLFQEFVRANSACIWNPEIGDAISSLEYKGTIVPSTILVGLGQVSKNDPCHQEQDNDRLDSTSSHQNFNNASSTPLVKVKLAWARKILKSPPGFRIEFLGEIEELLADPVEPSNFIPLSDSICWAIHELTGSGQEAFVDGILGELESSFPDTVLPPKELLYQVLERLIKAKKVYQTPKGYFITGTENKEEKLRNDENEQDSDEDSIYRKADNAPGAINKNKKSKSNSNSFRRCNSLRNSIKKSDRVGGCIPRRTFSLRGSKSKGKNKAATLAATASASASGGSGRLHKNEKSETIGSNKELTLSKESLVLDRRRKHKSFLKNLLTFRRSPASPSTTSTLSSWGRKSKNNKTGNNKNKTAVSKSGEESFSREISTQTSNSLENLGEALRLLSVSTSASPSSGSNSSSSGPHTPSPTLGNKGHHPGHDSDSGRYTESSEPDGKDHATPTLTPSSTPVSPSSSLINGKDDDLELRRLLSPTPTPSCSSSSAAYFYNNPYRRRYLGQYQYPNTSTSILSPNHSPFNHHSKSFTLSSSTPSSIISSSNSLKYPPRPWEKRAIYERLQSAKVLTTNPTRKMIPLPMTTKPMITSIRASPPISATSSTTTTSSSSNVQVEVLLPLGKLINQVHTDFKDLNKEKVEHGTQESEKTLDPSHIPKDTFSFKSSLQSNTSTDLVRSEVEVEVDVQFTARRGAGTSGGPSQEILFRKANSISGHISDSGVERISYKPSLLLGPDQCRESEII